MTVPLTSFYDYVLTDVPGVAKELGLLQIREAAIEYLSKTKLHQYTIPDQSVTAGDATYPLTPEAGMQVSDILVDGVYLNSLQLTPASPRDLDEIFIDWRSTGTGVPEYYFTDPDFAQITLVKTPSENISPLSIRVAQTLLPTTNDVPDWLFTRQAHRQGIAAGALRNLFRMKSKPWTDGDRAAYYGSLFQAAMGGADIKVSQGHTRKQMRVKAIAGVG